MSFPAYAAKRQYMENSGQERDFSPRTIGEDRDICSDAT